MSKPTRLEILIATATISFIAQFFLQKTALAAPAFGWIPLGIVALAFAVSEARQRLRAPDIVITVTQQLTPLMAKFLEQDRRLEKREQLKRQLYDLNGEIETFNAEMDADTRKAWQNRPGPYGK